MYEVVLEKQAKKSLSSIPPPTYTRIIDALKNLSENPRPTGYLKLKGRPGFRIRVGDYRIIYNIDDKILTVFVILIGNRKDIYD